MSKRVKIWFNIEAAIPKDCIALEVRIRYSVENDFLLHARCKSL